MAQATDKCNQFKEISARKPAFGEKDAKITLHMPFLSFNLSRTYGYLRNQER